MTREWSSVQIDGGHENGGVLQQGDVSNCPLYNGEEGDGHETRSVEIEEKEENSENTSRKVKQAAKDQGQEPPRGKAYYHQDNDASLREEVRANGEDVILLGMHEEGALDGVEGPVEEEERKDGSVEFHVRKKACFLLRGGMLERDSGSHS